MMRNRVAYLSEFLESPKGSMTVEFVAMAPVLIAVLVVGFEFGRAFWAYDVITRDLRNSVRYLARNSVTPPPYGGNVCPASAQNMAQTGNPADGTDANKHFPWKGVAATFSCPVALAFTSADYNVSGNVVTMTASVPVTLTLQDTINRVLNIRNLGQSDYALATTYTLNVSYQARYIGN